MGTVTSERPAWPSRLLAGTFYLGLAPLLALFRLQRRSAYLQYHCTQAVALVGLLAFLLLRDLAGALTCIYGRVYHADVMKTYSLEVIENIVSAMLLVPWALVWLLAIAVALRGSVWRVPLLWRLASKRWAFRVALVGNVGLGLVLAAVCTITLHALAITREADDRPVPVYMLYDTGGYPVPRAVYALGFYRIALTGRERWGPDSVVVAPLTEETLQQAMRHGRFVFLATHGWEGNITTPLVLVEPVTGISRYYLQSIARASTGDVFRKEKARRVEVGGDLQFVYVGACHGGEKEDVWRAALTPAEVQTFARITDAGEQALWMWWDGPSRIREIDPDPQLAPTQYRLGVALFEQRKWVEAEAAFRRAAELDPAFARAHGEIGAALLQQKKWAEAEAACRRAIKLDASHAVDHRTFGWALMEQEKWAEAESAYRRAVEIYPEAAFDHAHLGWALFKQHKWAEARLAYRWSSELDPRNAVCHYNLGVVLGEQKKWAEAEGPYRRAAELNPNNAAYHNDLGWALFKQRKWAEAASAYSRAAELAPETVVYHRHLGAALQEQRKWAEAEAAFRRAAKLNPDDLVTHNRLGFVLARQRKWAEAEKEDRRAAEIAPKNAVCQLNLGKALSRLGKWAEAERAYRAAVDSGDNRPAVAAGASRLRLAAQLHPLLPAYLAGDLRPAGKDECLALAAVCRFEQLHAGAARFFAAAFAADPRLADDLDALHRQHAACSAVLAAAGEGCDAPGDEQEKARLRGQALTWLKADLALWGQRLAAGKDSGPVAVRDTLLSWQEDADLAAVREKKALAALPDAERKQWTRLWADVAGLLRKAGGS